MSDKERTHQHPSPSISPSHRATTVTTTNNTTTATTINNNHDSDIQSNHSRSFQVDLQTSARSWLRTLRPLKRPIWAEVTLNISARGTLTIIAKNGLPSYPLKAKSSKKKKTPPQDVHYLTHQLIPGGARRSLNSEQRLTLRENLIILTTIDITKSSAENDGLQKRYTHLCQAKSSNDASDIIAFALQSSFHPFGGIPTDNELKPILMHLWGPYKKLHPKSMFAICNSLGLSVNNLSVLRQLLQSFSVTDSTYTSVNDFADIIKRIIDAKLHVLAGRYMHHGKRRGASRASWTKAHTFASVYDEQNSGASMLDILDTTKNSVVDYEKMNEAHDMTLPLTNYLISSSHNTYLTGDQLQSESSAEMYRYVLEKGCRCIEIDTWNGDSGEPIVTHGHTMTTLEPLLEVLKIIKHHSFSHGNEWPVIISLENHLDVEQQRVAAQQFQDVFGDKLYSIDENNAKNSGHMPSPSQLKGRIVLKSKLRRDVRINLANNPIRRSSSNDSDISLISNGSNGTEEDAVYIESPLERTDADRDQIEVSDARQKKRRRGDAALKILRKVKKKATHDDDVSGAIVNTSTAGASHGKKLKIADEYDKQVLLANGNRKELVNLWKSGVSGNEHFSHNTCVSFDERKLKEVYDKVRCLKPIQDYNRHALSRIYPKGSRIGSSNYTPTMAHLLGCQMVALNWQKVDSALAVNEARFMANANRGYVLADSVQQPECCMQNIGDTGHAHILEIRILCGFLLCLGKSSFFASDETVHDPHVTLKLYDEDFSDEDDFCSFTFETCKTLKSTSTAAASSLASPQAHGTSSRLTSKVSPKEKKSDDARCNACQKCRVLIEREKHQGKQNGTPREMAREKAGKEKEKTRDRERSGFSMKQQRHKSFSQFVDNFSTNEKYRDQLLNVWDDGTIMRVKNPNLAVINLKVYDRCGHETLGYSAVPVSLLREGVRCFPLKSKKGDDLTIPGSQLQSCVLCHVRWLSNDDGNVPWSPQPSPIQQRRASDPPPLSTISSTAVEKRTGRPSWNVPPYPWSVGRRGSDGTRPP